MRKEKGLSKQFWQLVCLISFIVNVLFICNLADKNKPNPVNFDSCNDICEERIRNAENLCENVRNNPSDPLGIL